jgi:hypothetical protein
LLLQGAILPITNTHPKAVMDGLVPSIHGNGASRGFIRPSPNLDTFSVQQRKLWRISRLLTIPSWVSAF